MRVVGGEYRGRILKMPRGVKTRPTQDRVREAIFNIIAPALPTSKVLDLYAGSGAFGIEAISRGAGSATFVENNAICVKVIKENCEAMELHNVEVVEKDVIDIKLSEQVDLAVIDLPEPLKAFKILKQVVKQSGFIVFYTPHISQAQDVVNALDDDYKYITTIELIQRRWEVGEKMLRPKHDMLGHTAFLTVVRKFAKN